ncbi:MAG: FAD-binding oxidoreductase [Micropepsaceae bacterium]
MSNKSKESFYRATAIGLTERPALKEQLVVDVCIIGAGYTGLSCALHLAGAGYKVIVLEAEYAGFGASGRNGGHVIPGQRQDQIELKKRYGDTQARALWNLALEAQSIVRSLIEAHKIQCDVKTGHLTAAVRTSHATELQEYVAHLEKHYNYKSARFIPEREIPGLVATQNYKGGLFDEQGMHLHPLNFALGLARAAETSGAQIFENSRVISVEHGTKIRTRTDAATITSDYVVYACNAYLEGLNRRLAATIMPISNYVAATEPLGEQRARALIPSGAAVADTKFVLDYYRLSADNRLIFGGGETYGARDSAHAEHIVLPCITRVFPQLNGIRIDYAWGGRLAITMPRMPHIGRQAANVYFAQGYSGQGVAIATLTGKLIAEAIGNQSARFDIMENLKIPQLPGGAMFRQPLLQLGLLWYALRDRLG